MRNVFVAVVETGSCDAATRTRWEERATCGHQHRTWNAAYACGIKHQSWSTDGRNCSALWYNFAVHNANGERLSEYGD